MNQIMKVSNLIFDIPRLVLYSVYRLGFVIIHPIFSLIYKIKLGRSLFNEIKLISIADFSFLAFVAQLGFVLIFILCRLTNITDDMTAWQFVIYFDIYPIIVFLIFGFFVNEWMKTYGNKDGGFVEEEPKSSLSLAGIEKLKPEIPVTYTGYDVPGRPFTYLPEARIRNFDEFPNEGFSARRVTTPEGVYTEYYNNGELVKRVKDYEV